MIASPYGTAQLNLRGTSIRICSRLGFAVHVDNHGGPVVLQLDATGQCPQHNSVPQQSGHLFEAVGVGVESASVRRTGRPSCVAHEYLAVESFVNLAAESLDPSKELQHLGSRCHQSLKSHLFALHAFCQEQMSSGSLLGQAFLTGLLFFYLFVRGWELVRRSC